MLVSDSLPHSLTHSCLVNLINVTLACEDTNSKLVDIVTVGNVDDCIGLYWQQFFFADLGAEDCSLS